MDHKALSKRSGSTLAQILEVISLLWYLSNLMATQVCCRLELRLPIDTAVGPPTPGWDGMDPSWLPIIPVTARWDTRTGKSLARTQLPLTMAWAITIHKSQGLTLERVTVDLGHADFSSGLSFVAISRVKTLKGLAFRTRFDQTRLYKPKETEMMKMLREDNERRSQLVWELDNYGMDLSEYLEQFYP